MSSSGEEGGGNGLVVLLAEAVEEKELDTRPLAVVLDVVTQKRKMTTAASEAWVQTVMDKLEDIGVTTVRDFLLNAVMINKKLKDRSHRELHVSTLNLILAEIVELVMGAEEPDEEDDRM
jgi:hypothetical protein